MPTRNNGPGAQKERGKAKTSDPLQKDTFVGDIGQEYPMRFEVKLRAAHLRYLKRLQRRLRRRMPELIREMQKADKSGNDAEDLHVMILRISQDIMDTEQEDAELDRDVVQIGFALAAWKLRQMDQIAYKTLQMHVRKEYFDSIEQKAMLEKWAQNDAQYMIFVGKAMLDRIVRIINERYTEQRGSEFNWQTGQVHSREQAGLSAKLKKDIQKAYDNAVSKASATACNETGNLEAAIAKTLYAAAGVVKYRWRTQRDELVRECHASFDNCVFYFDDPPEIWYRTKHGIVYTGRHCNPGEDYNCRCIALPVFERSRIVYSAFIGKSA